jgi:hypothetical protein
LKLLLYGYCKTGVAFYNSLGYKGSTAKLDGFDLVRFCLVGFFGSINMRKDFMKHHHSNKEVGSVEK